MHWIDYILLAMVAAVAIGAVVVLHGRKKQGKLPCGCDCSNRHCDMGCSACSQNGSGNKEERK